MARLRIDGSESLVSIAGEASGAEIEACARQSWALLLSTIDILLRRLESNTLLAGTIREEELVYDVHKQAAMFKARSEAVLPSAVLRVWASSMGYATLLAAMARGLDSLPLPWWPAAQKRSVESFVLRGLDVIPRTAGLAHKLGGC